MPTELKALITQHQADKNQPFDFHEEVGGLDNPGQGKDPLAVNSLINFFGAADNIVIHFGAKETNGKAGLEITSIKAGNNVVAKLSDNIKPISFTHQSKNSNLLSSNL